MGLIGDAVGVLMDLFNFHEKRKERNYQHDLQQKLFDREDSTIQRTVTDAQKAGINPLAALGHGGGAGDVVSTEAPEFKPDNVMASAQRSLMRSQRLQMQMQNRKTAAEIDNVNADTNLKNAQAADVPAAAEDRHFDAATRRAAQEAEAKYKDRSASTAEKAEATKAALAVSQEELNKSQEMNNWASLEKTKKETSKIEQEITNLITKNDLDKALIDTEELKQVVNQAQAYYFYKEGEYIDHKELIDSIQVELNKEKNNIENAKNVTQKESIVSRVITSAIGGIVFLYGHGLI